MPSPPRRDSDDNLPPGIVRASPLPRPLSPPLGGQGETARGVAARGEEEDTGDVALGKASWEVISLARAHRSAATLAEEFLWEILRRNQLGGFRFRRQHPLGQFIADFYCAKADLVVEIDGAYHNEPTQQERDHSRETIIEANGLTVLRFTNDEVLYQTETVVATIADFLEIEPSPIITPRAATPRAVSPCPPNGGERGRGRGEIGFGEARITALETQQKHDDRVSVYVDDKFALGIFADVAVSLGLRVGQAITPERLEEIARAETRRRAREDAYRLLSFRARSEKEVRDKLVRRDYEEEIIADTIAFLREHGYLDDAAFAQAWIRERGSARGKRALTFELKQKGVDSDTTANLLAETTTETERETARTLAVRRVGERPVDTSREARAKLAGFLQRRGFGWDAIGPVLNNLYKSGASDTEENTEENAD